MAGYTPVFDSVFKGSLYGKWPDTAAWICILALADWQGHVDIMPEAIAGMTGMPLADLLGCIERFCAPDPRSRSQAEEGRKLVPLDPARDWGWRVVNIQTYREKARNANQVKDGRNAEKVRKYKERHRKTPVDTGGHSRTRDSDSDSNSDSNTDKNKSAAGAAVVVLHESIPREEWEQWIALRRKRRWPIDELTLRKQLEVLRNRDTETQRQIINASINAGWQGLFPPKANGVVKPKYVPSLTTEEIEAQEAARAGK